jgi:hypothetical protein
MSGLNVSRLNAPKDVVSIMQRCNWRFRFNSGSLASLLNRLLPSGYSASKKLGAKRGLQVVITNTSGSKMLFTIYNTYSELGAERGCQVSKSDKVSLAGELSKLLETTPREAPGNRYWFNHLGEAEVTNRLAYQLKFPESALSEQSARETIPISFLIHERLISPYFRFNGPQLARVLNDRFEDLQVVSESFPENYGYLKLKIAVLDPTRQKATFELTVCYESVSVSGGKGAPFHLLMDKLDQIFGKFSAGDTWGLRIWKCQENPHNIWNQVAREIGPELVKEMWTSKYERGQRASLLAEPARQSRTQEPKKPNGAKAVAVPKKVKKERAARPAKLNVSVEGERTDFISAVEKWATDSIGKELLADYGNINIAISSKENYVTIVINAANNGNMGSLHVRSDGTLLIPMNGTSPDFISRIQSLLKKTSSLFQTVKKNKSKGKRKKETSRSYPNFSLADLKKLA